MADDKGKELAGTDFELLDREDEQQILDELRGIPVDKFVYRNRRGEYELSFAGTKWAVRKMAEQGEAIRIDGHPDVKSCPVDHEHIVVTVLAKRVKVDKDTSREISLDSTVGSSRGWIKQVLVDGRTVLDEHFFTKTVSKATRNAQQALMPVEFKKAMIAQLSGAKPPAKTAGDDKPRKPEVAAKPPQAAPEAASKAPEAPKPPEKPSESLKSPDDAGAARQRLMAAFKIALGDDVPMIRKLLKSWTGKEKTHDLDVKTMQSLTSTLHKIKEGSATYDANGVVDKVSGAVLIGKASASDPEPAPAPAAPAAEEPNYF